MRNFFALGDATVESASRDPVHSCQKQLATVTSHALSPAVVSVPLIIVSGYYHSPLTISTLAWTLLGLFLMSTAPATIVVIGVWRGWFTDLDISRRDQRFVPFLLGLLLVVTGYLAMATFQAPPALTVLFLNTIIGTIITIAVTTVWKISVHTSTIAGMATIFTLLYGPPFAIFFLLLLPVGWSRVVLRRHTLNQVLAGSVLYTALTLLIYGWQGYRLL